MSKYYTRDSRFPDGTPVVHREHEQGRIFGFDDSDGQYRVLVKESDHWEDDRWEDQWWNTGDFVLDPEPIPWPGEDKPLPGVLLHAPIDQLEGLEVFASIEELIADRPEDEASTLKDLALRAVANPDTWIEQIDGAAVVCYQLIEGGGSNARERRASNREASS